MPQVIKLAWGFKFLIGMTYAKDYKVNKTTRDHLNEFHEKTGFEHLPYTKEEWEEAIRIKNEHIEFMNELRLELEKED